MTDVAVLDKVLSVREKEKQVAQKEQQTAQMAFEKIATELYEQLKRKEMAEERLHGVLQDQDASSVEDMRNISLYIQSVSEIIPLMQKRVQMARKKMEEKQTILKSAHIEVKKIEKMIENRQAAQRIVEQRRENELMDEISLRQFQVALQNR